MIKHIKIDSTDVFLEDLGEGRGKISITNTDGFNYSTSWGATTTPLVEFLCKIDSDYFTKNLISVGNRYDLDVKGTFKNIRQHIRDEIMPWYEHKLFQSDMRNKLNKFQQQVITYNSREFFVDGFFEFIKSLDYDLLDGWTSSTIEKQFKDISEPWYFIETKKSYEYIWLEKLHHKLKKILLSEK